MKVGEILVIWTYLRIRVHLHQLNIHFDDFDPMSNLKDFFVKEPSAKSNLGLLLSVINESSAENDNIPNVTNINESISVSQPVEKGTQILKSERGNENVSAFDDEFDAFIERMETPPLSKKQKLDEPIENVVENVKNNEEPPIRSYSSLKRSVKNLPPWLRNHK